MTRLVLLAAAALASLLAGSWSRADQWPCFQHDPCHSGATSHDLMLPLEIRWEKSAVASYAVKHDFASLVNGTSHVPLRLHSGMNGLIGAARMARRLDDAQCPEDPFYLENLLAILHADGRTRWARCE